MAGYRWHIFHFPVFVKKGFKKTKMFFFVKKHYFFIFPYLSNFKIFLIFLLKKLHNQGGKDNFKKQLHLIRILHQICYL